MGAPVALVYVHHEGSGSPSDTARGASGGYTYWIGATVWTWLRSAWSSYATKGHNGITVDLCLSGNRMDHPVSDGDLALIEGAVRDARARGYVIETPEVRPHKATSSTACPGDRTMDRWNDVVAAVLRGTGGSTAPAPKPPKPPEEVPDMWVLSAECPAGRSRSDPETIQIGLPYGRKSARVDLYVNADPSTGVACYSSTGMEGTNFGLWSNGHTWEVWIPGRRLIAATIHPSARSLLVRHMGGTTAPLQVTISGT